MNERALLGEIEADLRRVPKVLYLINHIADDRRCRAGDCRELWVHHAISVGGHPEVRDLWQRITGSLP